MRVKVNQTIPISMIPRLAMRNEGYQPFETSPIMTCAMVVDVVERCMNAIFVTVRGMRTVLNCQAMFRIFSNAPLVG